MGRAQPPRVCTAGRRSNRRAACAAVRMATLVALPTDEDIREVGAADAGEYLLALQERAPKTFRRFLESHRPRLQQPDGGDFARAAKQPWLRTSGRPSCQVPPAASQIERLVEATRLDAVLYELARVLAARRTAAYAPSTPAG